MDSGHNEKPRESLPDVHSRIDQLCDQLEAQSQTFRTTAMNVVFAPIASNRMAMFTLLLEMRKLRGQFLPKDLFADPAWDILLELKLSEVECRRMTVTDAATVAQLPATTGLRWLTTLVGRGLVLREEDPFDRRKVYVRLHEDASQAIDNFLDTALTLNKFQTASFLPGRGKSPTGQ